MSDAETPLKLDLQPVVKNVRESIEKVNMVLEDIFAGNIKISKFRDIIDFVEILIDLLRNLLNAIFNGSNTVIFFATYVLDIIKNLLDIVIQNKHIIEMIVLIIPALPFLYMLHQIFTSF